MCHMRRHSNHDDVKMLSVYTMLCVYTMPLVSYHPARVRDLKRHRVNQCFVFTSIIHCSSGIVIIIIIMLCAHAA